ncbi:VTC domain-containing protein [Gilbertella persicaria]|uniref:VTC domain-containing protein n=1 Tax=Gilbertella persicaria TaxID=101096 RepID=UPI00221F5645|nr:VTC domain-containing protein [Gilbertella persicaria]KAI8069789.1 VTC domain-containing protein [Gilbertella persicaria]
MYEGLIEKCHKGEWNLKDEKEFESALRIEAAKVDLFINKKCREIETRLSRCQNILLQQASSSESLLDSTSDGLYEIIAEIKQLCHYIRTNYKALDSLIKEHDKLTDKKQKQLLVQICRTRFLDVQRLDPILIKAHILMHSCTKINEKVSNILNQNDRRVQYWIHPHNLGQVKSLLMFNFEMEDHPTTTTYLDNDNFDIYSSCLEHDDEARAISHYRTESLAARNQMFFKIDQYGSTARSNTNISQEYMIIEKDKIQSFLSQTYSSTDYIQFLRSCKFDQHYVDNCYTLFHTIQTAIFSKTLVPRLCVNSKRFLFKSSQDKAFVSLDTEICFSKEGENEEKNGFPHAVLEANINQMPQWLSQLIDSKLVFEVPRFSIFLHGVAQVWGSQLPLLPWWLSQLDIDIRSITQAKKLMQGMDMVKSQCLGSFLDYVEIECHRHSLQKENFSDQISSECVLTSSFSMKGGLRSRHRGSVQSFIDFYYGGRDDSSNAYMVYDADTVKENDEARATVIEMEDEEKKQEKKKKKKDKPRGYTIEPKQHLANERTFIHWLQFSALILTAALTLLNFGNYTSTIAGVTFFGISMIIAIYAYVRNRYRAYQISTRPHIRYDDLYGPIGLCTLFVGAMVLNFVLVYRNPPSSDTYLGVNNQTRKQPNNGTV